MGPALPRQVLQADVEGRAQRPGVASTNPFVAPPDDEGSRDEIALVRAAAIPDLRSKPVTLDAEAAVVFMRHRLVAAIPFAAGAAFRGDGYIVEVLSLSRPVYPDRTAAALLRMTQFPRLGHGSDPQLTFFQSDPARTVVNRATSPYPMQPRPARTPAYEWARARHWAVRFYAVVFETQDVGGEPRLLIVESRPAGEVATRIVWDAHPAGPR